MVLVPVIICAPYRRLNLPVCPYHVLRLVFVPSTSVLFPSCGHIPQFPTFILLQLLIFLLHLLKVCIVMTDGRSYDSVVGPARALRKRGVEVISLGLGLRYNIRQLRQMASHRRLVFTARFRNLNSVVRVIKRKVCGATGQSNLYIITWSLSKLHRFKKYIH